MLLNERQRDLAPVDDLHAVGDRKGRARPVEAVGKRHHRGHRPVLTDGLLHPVPRAHLALVHEMEDALDGVVDGRLQLRHFRQQDVADAGAHVVAPHRPGGDRLPAAPPAGRGDRRIEHRVNVRPGTRPTTRRHLHRPPAGRALVRLDGVEEASHPRALPPALGECAIDIAVEADLDEVRVREVVLDRVQPGADVEASTVRRPEARGLRPVPLDPLRAVVDVVLQAARVHLEERGVLDLGARHRGTGQLSVAIPIDGLDGPGVERLTAPRPALDRPTAGAEGPARRVPHQGVGGSRIADRLVNVLLRAVALRVRRDDLVRQPWPDVENRERTDERGADGLGAARPDPGARLAPRCAHRVTRQLREHRLESRHIDLREVLHEVAGVDGVHAGLACALRRVGVAQVLRLGEAPVGVEPAGLALHALVAAGRRVEPLDAPLAPAGHETLHRAVPGDAL